MGKNGPFTFGHSSFVRSTEIGKEDTLNSHQISCLADALKNMVDRGNNVAKIFYGNGALLYEYRTYIPDALYNYRATLPVKLSDTDLDKLLEALKNATFGWPDIKIAELKKKSHGIRIRFEDEKVSNYTKRDLINKLFANVELYIGRRQPVMTDPVLAGTMTATPGSISKVPVEELKHISAAAALTPVAVSSTMKGKKMKDFSLTNLKDALVDKVTHLDRRTVMILAIIALVLLIVGKYTTIKDIAKSIKDKVKRSKNFKAMVEDGTNAINGLKKIVGVKSGDKDEA